MEISRRGLMASMLAAIVGGTTMSFSNAVLADTVFGRYAMTIKLQEKLYATNSLLIEASKGTIWQNGGGNYIGSYTHNDCPDYLKFLFYRVNTEADELLAYMMEKFPPSNDVESFYQVDDLLRKRISVDTMSITELQKLMEATVPIAVAKNMISKERCALDTMVMKQFDVFARDYKHMFWHGRPSEQTLAMFPEWATKNRWG